MDSFFARNRLSAYLDGELSGSEARDVELALARDAALKAEFDEMRHAVDQLRGEGVVDAPRGFADRVRARTDREAMPVGWRRWARQIRLEPVLLAAAALLVVAYVGHRKDLPDLAPPSENVASAGAFPKTTAGSGEEQVAAVAPAEGATAGSTVENDGVLGNESGPGGAVSPAARVSDEKPPGQAKQQSMAPRKYKSSSGSPDVEPWQPEWEKESPVPTAAYDNTGGTYSNPDPAAQDNTGAPQQAGVQFFSPAPFRYRVAANDERGLKQLSAIAKELGGELQDSRGRPVAAWSLEKGDSRTLRVVVPAYNAAALAQRLREVGSVEAIRENDTLVKDANADVPVQIEVAF